MSIHNQKITKISNHGQNPIPYLRSILEHRNLVLTLAKSDIKTKYAQSYAGLFSAIFQPVIALVIFTVFFDKLMKIDTGHVAYPVFAFTGMIIWYFFSSMIGKSSNALVSSQDLIRKVYFPKLILPISKIFSAFFDFAIAFMVMLILLFIYKTPVSWTIVFVPIVIILVMLVGLACGVLISALSIKRRDALHIAPLLINYAIWLTPVFYPVRIVPEGYRDWIFYFNPLATVIHFFRACVLGTPIKWHYSISFVWIIILLYIGFLFFRRTEKYIADYI